MLANMNYKSRGGIKYSTNSAELSLMLSPLRGNGVFMVAACECMTVQRHDRTTTWLDDCMTFLRYKG